MSAIIGYTGFVGSNLLKQHNKLTKIKLFTIRNMIILQGQLEPTTF